MNNRNHGIDGTSCCSPISEKPMVSVIINCHNGEQFLKQAIDSVISQTVDSWELVFWDNASNDSSADILQTYSDSRIRYFRDEVFEPLYTARNSALNQCEGKYVTFIDCDDVWVPEKLELELEITKSGAKFVFGRYQFIDANGVEFAPKHIHKMFPRDIEKSMRMTNRLLKRNPISMSCVLLERELISEYRFNPVYELLGDFDLWIRLSLIYPIYYLEQITGFHRQHSSNLSDRRKDLWLTERRHFYKEFVKKEGLLRYPLIMLYIMRTEAKGLLNVW